MKDKPFVDYNYCDWISLEGNARPRGSHEIHTSAADTSLRTYCHTGPTGNQQNYPRLLWQLGLNPRKRLREVDDGASCLLGVSRRSEIFSGSCVSRLHTLEEHSAHSSIVLPQTKVKVILKKQQDVVTSLRPWGTLCDVTHSLRDVVYDMSNGRRVITVLMPARGVSLVFV